MQPVETVGDEEARNSFSPTFNQNAPQSAFVQRGENRLRRNTPLECLQLYNFDTGREPRLYIVCCHYQTSDAVAFEHLGSRRQARARIDHHARWIATGHVSHSELWIVGQRGTYTHHNCIDDCPQSVQMCKARWAIDVV